MTSFSIKNDVESTLNMLRKATYEIQQQILDPSIKLYADDITPNTKLADEYTYDGNNYSPMLTWTRVPNVVEYVITLTDQNVEFTHWILYNIPNSYTSVPKAGGNTPPLAPLSTTMKQGVNSRDGGNNYVGPFPPEIHTYKFKIYALSDVLTIDPVDATLVNIQKAIKNITITSDSFDFYFYPSV